MTENGMHYPCFQSPCIAMLQDMVLGVTIKCTSNLLSVLETIFSYCYIFKYKPLAENMRHKKHVPILVI